MASIEALRLGDIMSSRVHVVRPEHPVSDAVSLMREARVSCLVVVEERTPIGILTEKDLLGLFHLDPGRFSKVKDIMSGAVISAMADTDFQTAYSLLRRHGIRHLVVADASGALVGVATATDFRAHLNQEVFSKIDHLHAVLDPVVSQLPPATSLDQAIRQMKASDWDYVLVTENGMPLGILTERDIPRLWNRGANLHAVALSEVMTRPLHCIPVTTQVAEASATMGRLGLRHLPVVDADGLLLGVVSQNRMLEKLGLVLFDEVWRERDSLQAQNSDLAARLGLILENSGVGVWEYDHENDNLAWNPRFALLCGKPEGWAPTGLKGWMDLLHPQDRPHVFDQFRTALSQDAPQFEAEFRLRSATGQWLWVEARGRVLDWDARGRPRRTAGSMFDVSELKNAALLMDAQRRFMEVLVTRPDREALLQAALDFALSFPDLDGGAVFRRSPGGHSILAHRGISEQFDATWRDLSATLPLEPFSLGRLYCSCPVRDELCPVAAIAISDCGRVHALAELFAARDGAQAAVLLPLGVDGDHHWEGGLLLVCRHVPRISSHTANALQSLANLFDQALLRLRTQEEVESQNALALGEKSFSEELINALPGGFHMTDGADRLLRWNRQLTQLTGRSDAELAAMNGVELYAEADRPRMLEASGNALLHGSATLEAGVVASSGAVVPFLLTAKRSRIAEQDYLLFLGVDISESKRVRRSLDEERLRLRSLLNTIPDLVWLKDPEGVYLFCNPSCERLMGTSEAEIIGKTDYDFFDRETGDFFRGRDLAAVAAGVTLSNEEWLTSSVDGRSALYETSKTPLLNLQGELVGVLGISRDITARRQAEEAAQASAREYEDLVARIPVGVYKLQMSRSGAHRFIYVSPRWCEILGVDAAEVLADERHAFDHIHPADRDGFLRANEAAAHSLDMFEWEGRFLKDGEVRWIHIESRPSLLENGEILWNGIQYDITDRRNVEEAMRRASSMFHHTQEGIIITDAGNNIIDVNPAFTQITGYSREEVLGKNPKMLGSGVQDRYFYQSMWRAVTDQGSWRGEVCNRRKSGELYTEMLSIAAVRDRSGRIQEYVGVFSDISRLKEHAAELNRIAHFDPLTGLPNRRLLADRLNLAIAHARRNGKLLAVCYLDLDGFKPVNDRFGHDAGDRLLVMLTRHLQEVLRAEDTLARLGGDEFVLLLNDLHREQECSQLLERVLDAVSRPLNLAKHVITLSASIGVTLYPHDPSDGDTLLRHADQAMYRAKESGRNRFHLFDPEYDRQLRVQREFLQRVAHGLRNGEFVLYYQPMVNLVLGEVVGMEALVRWQHPEDGLLMPGAFLPMLAGTELDAQLGDWVLDAALAQMARWKAQDLNLGVSVNISAEHLLSPDFVHRLEMSLQRHSEVVPGNLELEILETVAISDLEKASEALREGLRLGVNFALDDFGTGYSSLTYFRRLPVHSLKVDGSFVRDMLDDPDDLGIVESVIHLAEAFNRKVIAEGVETPQHATLLVKLGCKLGQGYGIARPMPAEEVVPWMENWFATRAWKSLGGSCLPVEDTALLLAMVSHRQWCERVSRFVRDPQGSPPVLGSRSCRLGQWYYRSGIRRYGTMPEFQELETLHEAFHNLANQLLRLAEERSLLAEARLPELFEQRDAVLQCLEHFIERLQAS